MKLFLKITQSPKFDKLFQLHFYRNVRSIPFPLLKQYFFSFQ